ncbi:MAG: alpha/beta hydrolase [Betaproteobacteria bacterium]
MPHLLEVRSALPPPRRRNDLPPLLFVHGAYCDAWCWDLNILPWFAAAGYEAHALSLRGHGKSPGREDLESLSLSDYVDDVTQVVGSLSARPVLIGHSMGATLVDRLIAEEAFPAAALICPIPPSGLMASLTRLWWSRPEFFWHAQKLHHGALDPVAMNTLREFYFTPNAPPEVLAAAMRHLSPESPRAVMELAWRGAATEAAAPGTPLRVFAAGADVLFTAAEAQATAARHGVDAVVLDDLPHMLMLEPGWERLAEALDEWIRSAVAVSPASRRRAPAR